MKFCKAEFYLADFRGEKFYRRAMAAKIDATAPVRKLKLRREPLVIRA